MIVKWLSKLMIVILKVLIALLPTYTPPSSADLSAFQVIAWLVPINEIVTLSSALALFAVISITYVGINWVINKVRGSG